MALRAVAATHFVPFIVRRNPVLGVRVLARVNRSHAPRLALALLALGACRSGSASLPEARADEPASSAKGVAVVELFTSEGCSSCPPADDLLAELARTSDRPVYALAFHVDYWDDLGWPDRFASHESTMRQRAYARAFGTGGVYTPQMIVGGTEQFTGSDRGRAASSVARALSHPAEVQLVVRPRASGPDSVTVDFEAPGAPSGAVLNVAVVERSVSTSVRAGENAGKTLQHANVVRAFLTTPFRAPAGSVVLHLPPSVPHEGAELIAYVQQPSSDHGGMPVLGAARAQLPH